MLLLQICLLVLCHFVTEEVIKVNGTCCHVHSRVKIAATTSLSTCGSSIHAPGLYCLFRWAFLKNLLMQVYNISNTTVTVVEHASAKENIDVTSIHP